MAKPDLNLLITMEALLRDGSVTKAARRLQLSPSAMSRAFARLRRETGDPLLVRAGRGLVPTPRAQELREKLAPLLQEAEAVLRPRGDLDLRRLERTFVVRASDGFVESFGPALIARVREVAPAVRLHFLQKMDKDSRALREGAVDLETGVVNEETSPELRTQVLFRDRIVGVVRPGHPLTRGRITASRYAGGDHVLVSRQGHKTGAVDAALEALGLERRIVVVVSGFAAALALAQATDLVASVPERHTTSLRKGLRTFKIPLPAPDFAVSLLWHPRMDSDPGHQWLRNCLRKTCGSGR